MKTITITIEVQDATPMCAVQGAIQGLANVFGGKPYLKADGGYAIRQVGVGASNIAQIPHRMLKPRPTGGAPAA